MFWGGGILAVDGCGRGEDDALDAGSACGFVEGGGAGEVDVVAVEWVGNRVWDGDLCGEVKEVGGPGGGSCDAGYIRRRHVS